VLQCVAVCCSVLQCVAVCCSVLQYFGVDKCCFDQKSALELFFIANLVSKTTFDEFEFYLRQLQSA